jgi:pyrroline-5-carboxylate reductase
MNNNFLENKILFLGCGKMGGAILLNILDNSKLNPSNILICKKSPEINISSSCKNDKISQINITNIKNIPQNFTADIVFICIKPQNSDIVIEELLNNKNCYHHNTIFISILAGKKINFFTNILTKNNLKLPKIIRIMPNIGLYHQLGVIPYMYNQNINDNEMDLINHYIFINFGKLIMLNQENEFDVFTAIFGSGPALIFYLQKIFTKITSEYGINIEISENLIKQLFLGSAKFASNSNSNNITNSNIADFDYLISQIASKGGTTEVAINILDDNNKILENIIRTAINKAIIRSKELSL